MSVPFLTRTRERVIVPAPQDDALTPEQRAALEVYDLTPRPWPEGAALFTLRGLSDSERAQLRPIMPAMPEEVAELTRTAATGDVDERALRLMSAYLRRVSYVVLRAALVSVSGVEGWPSTRQEHLGLLLWPEETLDGLPPATVAWLAEVAQRLTTLDPEKKRPSSSVPAATTGTMAESTHGATAAGSG